METIKTVNIWKRFADNQGWSDEDFEKEVLLMAQAVLAFKISKNNFEKLEITSTQYDGNYKLTFEREG